jgi:hypothetical protein
MDAGAHPPHCRQSLVCRLSLSLTQRGCWGNTGPLPGTSHTPVALIIILT